MINYKHYTYRVTWSEEDQEFVGLVAEFPSLSYLDENQDAALIGIVELVKQVMDDMMANNEPLPEPLSEKKYSGNLQLRLTPDEHRRLAIEAKEQNVSLSKHIRARLRSAPTTLAKRRKKKAHPA